MDEKERDCKIQIRLIYINQAQIHLVTWCYVTIASIQKLTNLRHWPFILKHKEWIVQAIHNYLFSKYSVIIDLVH